LKKTLATILTVDVGLLIAPELGQADVEWTLKKQLNLDAKPLDIFPSTDGQWIFVLVEGEILVYSMPEDKIVKRIPVDREYDSLQHSPAGNILIVASRSAKAVKIIKLGIIHHFDLSELPFKGPANAPVTIAAFFDYQ
jgi:hypothetical protein